MLGPFLSKIAPGMVDKGGKARKKKEREKQKAANPFEEIQQEQPWTRGEMKKEKGNVNCYEHLSTV